MKILGHKFVDFKDKDGNAVCGHSLFVSYHDDYYVTYSPTYVNIYGHDSADGESTANDTDSQLYYSLPDGRNSFYCTPSDVFGTSYLYNVKNADLVLEDDGKTLGLWHLDGNFYDSSNWGHHATSSSYWFMDLGWNGGFRYSMNSMFNGPLVFPYDTSSLGSSDYWEIEFRVFISGGHGRAVFPFCFTAGGASRYAILMLLPLFSPRPVGP